MAVEWLEPWVPIEEYGPGAGPAMAGELTRELGPGHPLYRVPVEAIGRRGDRDDVLFRLLDGSGRVAVVHLTWTRSPPERYPWPATAFFPSVEAWVVDDMSADHREFTDSDEASM